MDIKFPRIKIISFKLSLSGLIIHYSTINSRIIVEFDSLGTCEELQNSNFISGYIKGPRVPPQILKGRDLEFIGWPRFVKTFQLTKEMVHTIAQKHYQESHKIKSRYN